MASVSPKLFAALLSLSAVVSFVSLVHGKDSADLNPITAKEWAEATTGNKKMLVVFYKKKACASCPAMVKAVTDLVGNPDLDGDLQFGKSTDTKLASDLGIATYPTVVFLRDNSHVFFDGKPDSEEIVAWLEVSRSTAVKHLFEDTFEHLTQASTGATTGDWLVAFFRESCKNIIPVMETIGVRIRQQTNVAVVDADKNTLLADRFAIEKCPEVILFKQGKMYRHTVPKTDAASLKSFVQGWYKNSKAETVLPPKSRFDFLTEGIATYIKNKLEGENRRCCLLTLGGAVAAVCLLLLVCCRSGSGEKKSKTE